MKVYLASPFFNNEQIERIEFVENSLDKLNYNVFSPRKVSKITKNCSKNDMLLTFEGNINNINDSDFVLAILDGNDAGTMFECGYAYSLNKPILYFNETRDKSKGPNLMLALSTNLQYCLNRDELINNLTNIKLNGLKKSEYNNDFSEVE